MKFSVKIMALIIYPFYKIYNAILFPLIKRIQLQLLILELKTCGAQIGNSLHVGKRVGIFISKDAKLIIGNNVVFGDDVYIKVRKNAVLKIGNNTHIN